jgi:hypothetical protein
LPPQRGQERRTVTRTPVTASVAAETAGLCTRPVPPQSVQALAGCFNIVAISLLLARCGSQSSRVLLHRRFAATKSG